MLCEKKTKIKLITLSHLYDVHVASYATILVKRFFFFFFFFFFVFFFCFVCFVFLFFFLTSVYVALCESHAVEAISNFGRMSVLYAADLWSLLWTLMFLFSKSCVWLAFFIPRHT